MKKIMGITFIVLLLFIPLWVWIIYPNSFYRNKKAISFYKDKDNPFTLSNNDTSFYLRTKDNVKLYSMLRCSNHTDIILFLHDSNRDVESSYFYYQFFQFLGYDIFSFDYRGTGLSNGTFNSSKLVADADLAIAYLLKIGYNMKDVIICSESNSLAFTLQIDSLNKAKGLVLLSPKHPLPWHNVIDCNYLEKRISSVNGPSVLIMVGDYDDEIALCDVADLYSAIPRSVRKRMVILNGVGHYDLYYSDEFIKEIRAFLPTKTTLNSLDTLSYFKW